VAAIKPLQRRAMLVFAFAVIGFLSPATFLTDSHPIVPRLGIRRTTPLPPMRMAPCICNGGRIGGRRIGGRSGLRKPLVAEATRDDDDDNDQVSRSSHSWHSPEHSLNRRRPLPPPAAHGSISSASSRAAGAPGHPRRSIWNRIPSFCITKSRIDVVVHHLRPHSRALKISYLIRALSHLRPHLRPHLLHSHPHSIYKKKQSIVSLKGSR
jgi:hypothetical protein